MQHRPRYVTMDMPALKSAALWGLGLVQLPILMLQLIDFLVESYRSFSEE